MNEILSFVIPVAHPDNVRDWPTLRDKLAATVRSIQAQSDPAWKAVIVAQNGVDLPELPAQFVVERVTFPPNPYFQRSRAQMTEYLNAVRIDKGRRLLAGILRLQPRAHIMLVDADDFISNRIVEYVAKYPEANGWVVDQGYGWQDGGRLMYLSSDFHNHCGTSHIVRADLYRLPEGQQDATDDYVSLMLGSHRYIDEYLREQGTPLAELPFPGAIYRIGQAESHSHSPGVIAKFLYRKTFLKKPWLLVAQARRFRFLDAAVRGEFFGQ